MTVTDLYKRTHKSVAVIFEPPCIYKNTNISTQRDGLCQKERIFDSVFLYEIKILWRETTVGVEKVRRCNTIRLSTSPTLHNFNRQTWLHASAVHNTNLHCSVRGYKIWKWEPRGVESAMHFPLVISMNIKQLKEWQIIISDSIVPSKRPTTYFVITGHFIAIRQTKPQLLILSLARVIRSKTTLTQICSFNKYISMMLFLKQEDWRVRLLHCVL